MCSGNSYLDESVLMDHDALLTFILMAILLAIFTGAVYSEKKARKTGRSRKHLSLYTVIAASLVFIGSMAFGLKIIFLIISFAILFVILTIGK
jgi:membrane-associated HD superfamily phosphohydrolase